MRDSSEGPTVSGRAPTEQKLLEIWREVLANPTIGVHHNFADLGGHSLNAVQVVARIRERFRVDLPMRAVFECQTIAGLAPIVDQAPTVPEVPLSPREMETGGTQVFPSSFGEEQLWLIEQSKSTNGSYNLATAIRLRGPLKGGALKTGLDALIRRHDSLRTTFETRGGGLMQVVAPRLAIEMPKVDLEPLSEASREAEAERLMVDEGLLPFDLSRGPLVRAKLFRLHRRHHILLLVMHHLVSDGWSMDVMLKELARHYEGESSPGDLPVQYGNFAEWQRRHLTRDVADGHLRYWQRQLSGVPAVLNLPPDRRRRPVAATSGGIEVFHVSPRLTAALRALGSAHRATLFMTLLAAYQTLLHRHSLQKTILVGTPFAGRRRRELECMVGFFVNTLPIKADFSEDPSFAELLRQVRDTVWGAGEHQDLPFGKLVGALAPERRPGRNPLFQASFVLQDLQEMTCRARDLVFEAWEVPLPAAMFDLGLSMAEQDGGLCGVLTYDTELFEPATATCLVEHYLYLLHRVVEDSSHRVSDLSLISEPERRQVLAESNNTKRDYPRDRCVHQLFEAQAARTPDAVAVRSAEQQLTYRELDEAADRLSHRLHALGVGPGVPVGLCVERSLDMVVGLLGILKAGGAYVPLDAALPGQRMAFMIDDVQCPLVLTQRALGVKLPASVRVLYLDDAAPLPTHPTTKSDWVTAGADTMAYVMYTSGSTGSPKGVCITHRAIARLVVNTDYVQLGPADVVAQVANAAFDAATFEVWGALLNGARLEIVSSETLLAPHRFAALLRERRVTTLFLTTAVFNLLAREVPGVFRPLKHVLFGGEAVDPAAVRAVLRDGPPQRLLHVYGPTESTTFASWQLVKEVPEEAATVPIGRPVSNTEVYLLDARQQPVPAGVPGEIYIGGDGVAMGYWRQDSLTAERFVPHPFQPSNGARLYRTGDLARRRTDGAIEFLERLDDQVKVRGFRIEPGEIEVALRACQGVRDAAVVCRKDLPADRPLVAYVVGESSEPLNEDVLRDHIRGRLPEYMMPSAFVMMGALPLTPNGKLDRQRLPSPDGLAVPSPRCDEPAQDLLEFELIRVWEQLFERGEINRRDNFFDLGGHSLLAIRLVAEVEKRTGYTLDISTVFQSPTVEQLARRLTDADWAPPWSSLVPLQPRGSRPPVFFVHGWNGSVYTFLSLAKRLGPDQPAYGLQAVGLDNPESRHTTVEDMAAHYVREIRSLQPEGPYYLAGYSLGGLFAYEMAQQLRGMGQRVALLAMFDTHPMSGLPAGLYTRAMMHYLPRRAWFHLARWWRVPAVNRLHYLGGRWRSLRRWLRSNRTQSSAAASPLDPRRPHGEEDDYYIRVAAAYPLREYPGRLDLIVSDDPISQLLAAWELFAPGRVVRHRVSGEHSRLMQPESVDALSIVFQDVLERAQAEEHVKVPPEKFHRPGGLLAHRKGLSAPA